MSKTLDERLHDAKEALGKVEKGLNLHTGKLAPDVEGQFSPLRTKSFDDLQRNAQRRPSLFGSGLPGRQG
jgi:hypothetical protein